MGRTITHSACTLAATMTVCGLLGKAEENPTSERWAPWLATPLYMGQHWQGWQRWPPLRATVRFNLRGVLRVVAQNTHLFWQEEQLPLLSRELE